MYSYGQCCPMTRASEILSDRWIPLSTRRMEGAEAGSA